MRLTTKGRFAVTAMIDLAMNAQTGAVKLSAISERQSISLSYLDNYSANCAVPDWLKAYAAPVEGYILAAPAETNQYCTNHLRSRRPTGCHAVRQQSKLQPRCPLPDPRPLGKLKQTINDYLSGVTLQTSLTKKLQRQQSCRYLYTHSLNRPTAKTAGR